MNHSKFICIKFIFFLLPSDPRKLCNEAAKQNDATEDKYDEVFTVPLGTISAA
jgi:hypothetical protein